MFVVHTSNCHGQNCTRRAIYRLGIDTLIANILDFHVISAFICTYRMRAEVDAVMTAESVLWDLCKHTVVPLMHTLSCGKRERDYYFTSSSSGKVL